nr:serine/arginine repetitive matrix protein 1-like [Aegilops tauschii subsp. strangulata]
MTRIKPRRPDLNSSSASTLPRRPLPPPRRTPSSLAGEPCNEVRTPTHSAYPLSLMSPSLAPSLPPVRRDRAPGPSRLAARVLALARANRRRTRFMQHACPPRPASPGALCVRRICPSLLPARSAPPPSCILGRPLVASPPLAVPPCSQLAPASGRARRDRHDRGPACPARIGPRFRHCSPAERRSRRRQAVRPPHTPVTHSPAKQPPVHMTSGVRP